MIFRQPVVSDLTGIALISMDCLDKNNQYGRCMLLINLIKSYFNAGIIQWEIKNFLIEFGKLHYI